MKQDDKPQASRRKVLQAGLGVVAAGAAGVALSRRAAAQEKIKKELVQYQEKPNANGQHCSLCANFVPPNSCNVVEGKINPNGWCGAFAPKA